MRLPAIVSALILVGSLHAQALPSAQTKIALWPEGIPGFRPDAPKEVDTATHVEFVDQPSVTVFPASPAKATGAAVIVCPGGGYVRLAMQKEGTRIAEWLNSIGVSAFVLRYRMKEYGYPAPQQDVLRAIRLVRSRAAEFRVNPARIGVLGASAGGHLCASAGTLYDSADGRTGNTLDAVSARPDFLILLYPVITMKAPLAHEGSVHALLGKNPSTEQRAAMSLETRVTKDTPPAFLVQAEDDKTVPVENSMMFYEALHQAGVPAELHLYPKGGHGFGIPTEFGPLDDWPVQCEEWLRQNGWLTGTLP